MGMNMVTEYAFDVTHQNLMHYHSPENMAVVVTSRLRDSIARQPSRHNEFFNTSQKRRHAKVGKQLFYFLEIHYETHHRLALHLT